jgi:NADH dehydrogenase FAD-containing subunit
MSCVNGRGLPKEFLSLLEIFEEYRHLDCDIDRFNRAVDITEWVLSSEVLRHALAKKDVNAIEQQVINTSPDSCPSTLFDPVIKSILKNIGHRITAAESGCPIKKYIAELELYSKIEKPESCRILSPGATAGNSHETSALQNMSTDSDEECISNLVAAMQKPTTGIRTYDVKVGNTIHRNVCTGSSIVSWLARFANSDRHDALQLAEFVQEETGMFIPIDREDDTSMYDTNRYYRFTNRRKRIVIVGGGYAGIIAAKKLENDFDVVLVTGQDKFECSSSFPLLFQNPDHVSNIRSSYSECFERVSVIIDRALHISPTCVVLAGHDISTYDESVQYDSGIPYIEYDYLVICTGCRKASHVNYIQHDNDNRATIINPYECRSIINQHDVFERASRIVVVGGGPMALEVVGEVAQKYKKSLITVLTRSKCLLARCGNNVSKAATQALKSFKNVKVRTEADVITVRDRVVQYRVKGKAKEMNADLVIDCSGITPNSEILDRFMRYCLDSNRAVRVNQHFQVAYNEYDNAFHSNIFALGDVTNLDELKQASFAMNHAKQLSSVIKSLEANERLPVYRMELEPLAISLGADHALLVCNGKSVLINKFARQIKHRLETKLKLTMKSKELHVT